MPTYRFRKDGYFMGRYFEKGQEIELHDKQAKYACLSNQLEPVELVLKERKAAPSGPVTPFFAKPATGTKKALRDNQGEFSTGGKVGGTFGGTARR